MKIMINDESDISDYEEDDLNILEDKSTSDNESEACECIGNCTCDYKEINTIEEDDDEITSLIDLFDMKSGFWQIQIDEKDKYKKKLRIHNLCKPLYDRLKKNPKPWIEDHTKVVRNIKNKIKELPCLNIPHPDADLIVETDASDIGYGGILKQRLKDSKTESLVRFYLGSSTGTSPYRPDLGSLCKPLYDRLKKNPKPWTEVHTKVVGNIKNKIKELPCLDIPHPDAYFIVETDASDIGYGGSLCKPLYDRLKKNPKPWTEDHTKVVRNIKNKIKELPCLNIPHPDADLIVETYASDIGYGEVEGTSPPLLVRQFSAKWWKQINESQADKEAVIKYYNNLIQESPSTSTSKLTSNSKLSKINVEIAKKIEECKNDKDFARVINQIRSSPTPSEDLFQDSQDPYDGIDL
ncbi:reverse transcriptase domain, zinc finger, CCHC-type, aspartic peptidase domain protein [Tanacetum coccineum]